MTTTTVPVQALRTLFARMKGLGLRHCLEVYPEKGSWAGEDPWSRMVMIQNRLLMIRRVREGTAPPNDDGTPRTLEGEYAKLVCSVAILGEDIGVCRGIS